MEYSEWIEEAGQVKFITCDFLFGGCEKAPKVTAKLTLSMILVTVIPPKKIVLFCFTESFLSQNLLFTVSFCRLGDDKTFRAVF